MLNSKIVSGGEAYLNGMKTVENVFPKEMFLSNTVIETVILPKEAVEVAYHAFFGCSTLKKSFYRKLYVDSGTMFSAGVQT